MVPVAVPMVPIGFLGEPWGLQFDKGSIEVYSNVYFSFIYIYTTFGRKISLGINTVLFYLKSIFKSI